MENNCQFPEYQAPSLKKRWFLALLLLALLIASYFVLAHSNAFSLMAKLNDQKISLPLIFIIGLLSGFNCIGICGGFVAAYCAKSLGQGEKIKLSAHWRYNLGRLISYSLVGLLLGAIGGKLQMNETVSGNILLLTALFMVYTGFKLLTGVNIFGWIKLPNVFSQILYSARNKNIFKTPLIIGLLTAFIPCSLLSAMYLYALSSGSAARGFLVMAFYALGTIPAMFSLGWLIGLLTNGRIKIILKISGAIIIILGFAVAVRGAGNFSFVRKAERTAAAVKNDQKEISAEQYFANSVPLDKYQTVEIEITPSGFKPNAISIRNNLPIRLIVKNGGATACTDEIIVYNGAQELTNKILAPQSIIKFMPLGGNEIKFSSKTKMVWGKFIVNDK